MYLGVPSTHSPRHTLLGKTHQVIHLLTRAEKQVQLDSLIPPAPLLAGMVPAAAPSAPSQGVVYPSCVSGLHGHFWFQGHPAGVQVGLGAVHRDSWLIVGTGQVHRADVVLLWQEFRGIDCASCFWSLALRRWRG